jgi:nitroimidazol reductase NimA-like FMN-containing flavoprotein (pyridoxamine 5'-phosphate oxidase superfamily)
MACPLDRPEVGSLLAATPWADVAVETATGPHVTPAAFAASCGRIWVVSSRRSLRVRSVRRTGRAAVLVRGGDGALVVAGAAEVLSLWRPEEVRALLTGGLPAARAAGAYAWRNAPQVLAGVVEDLVRGSGDPTVYDRVLVSIAADRGMRLDGDRVVDSWGRWRSGGAAPRHRRPAAAAPPTAPLGALLDGVPGAVLDAVANTTVASLGWATPAGPVVLPAAGASAGDSVQVASAALDLAGIDGGAAACLTVHHSPGRRPSRFRGVVLRGQGQVVRRGPARTRVRVRAERVSWWSGYESGTARAEGAAAAAA